MKRTFSIVFIFLVVVFVILFMRFKELRNYNLELMKFNSEYEIYDEERINGLDVISAITKAVDNNEKYLISKDENGCYNTEDENCVEIYLGFIADDEGNIKIYKMDNVINKAGINELVSLYSSAHFKCDSIKYNSNTGKVKSLTFIELEN